MFVHDLRRIATGFIRAAKRYLSAAVGDATSSARSETYWAQRCDQSAVNEVAQRSSGHGTAAMQAVETFARERSAAGITLNVFAHNDGAIRLYERLEAAKGGQRMRKQL